MSWETKAIIGQNQDCKSIPELSGVIVGEAMDGIPSAPEQSRLLPLQLQAIGAILPPQLKTPLRQGAGRIESEEYDNNLIRSLRRRQFSTDHRATG